MKGAMQASFRDPAGFVFEENGELYRQIRPCGRSAFEMCQQSGLAVRLMEQWKMAPYSVVSDNEQGIVLHIKRLEYITYPYEWCFSQLRDAALLTLELMFEALDNGLILKDASAFNVAFQKCKPVFLDHTSFEEYKEGSSWRAYRQLIMHFVAPLLLMQKVDLRCLQLFRSDIDGIPLDLASRLLPMHTWFHLNPLLHIHLHSLLEKKVSSDKSGHKTSPISKRRLLALLKGLQSWIKSMKMPKQSTAWENYYSDNSYSDEGFAAKERIVREYCSGNTFHSLIDLGANSGVFTRIAAESVGFVIAADYDQRAVEALYRLGKTEKGEIQPLLLDLNNPSPDLGVLCAERDSFFRRTKVDCALGLALIHHLRITGNWSIKHIVTLFDKLASNALVEFVPLEDIQVKRLTRGRDEIYQDWSLGNVCRAFQESFNVRGTYPIPDSGRVLIEITKR